MTLALYLCASFTISGRLARSPSMLKTPSTTISFTFLESQRLSCFSSESISLCRNLYLVENDVRIPSIMDAWSLSSQMIYSSLPVRHPSTPSFTLNPVEKTTASSLFIKLASFLSSSRWMSRVPFKKRDPAIPVPYFLVAATAASFTFGWLVSPR